MKIILFSGLSGPGINVLPGETYECDDAEAQRHIDAGHAVRADDQSEPKPAAAKKPIERAVKKGPAETR